MELFSTHVSWYWKQANDNHLSWDEFASIVKRNTTFVSLQEINYLVDLSSKVNDDSFCDECRVALLDSLLALAINCPSQKRVFISAMQNINHESRDYKISKARTLQAFG